MAGQTKDMSVSSLVSRNLFLSKKSCSSVVSSWTAVTAYLWAISTEVSQYRPNRKHLHRCVPPGNIVLINAFKHDFHFAVKTGVVITMTLGGDCIFWRCKSVVFKRWLAIQFWPEVKIMVWGVFIGEALDVFLGLCASSQASYGHLSIR